MRKMILLALFAVALIAAPAFASVQNVKISGDIGSTWVVRDQFDLGQRTTSGGSYYQNFLLTQTRLRVDADLTDNVSTTVGLLNERTWGSEDLSDTSGNNNNDIDLNLAYVTLREMLYSPLTVTIGRQAFAYGNSFVIDSAGANNVVASGGLNGAAEDLTARTALDAIRMVLDYKPLTIDLVAAKVTDNNNRGNGAQDDDVDLFGVNANYQLGDSRNTVVESYFWSKLDQSVKNTAGDKADAVYMPGVRVATNPIKDLNVSAELAWQFGNKTNTDSAATIANVKRNAIAAQVISNYALPLEVTKKWNPMLMGAYTFVSGDSNALEAQTAGGNGEDTYTAWDPMFENQAAGKIYNTLFDLTNGHIITSKLSLNPMEDVTASVQWDGMWVNKEVNGGSLTGDCQGSGCFTMRFPDGRTSTPHVTTDTSVGQEIGLGLTYDYTEDVKIGGNVGWFFPGDFFHGDNQDAASQYLVNANVSF